MRLLHTLLLTTYYLLLTIYHLLLITYYLLLTTTYRSEIHAALLRICKDACACNADSKRFPKVGATHRTGSDALRIPY